MNSKRICLLISSLSGGGAERSVLNLAREFAAVGHEVHIIVFNKKDDYQLKNSDIRVHLIEPEATRYDNLYKHRLQEMIRRRVLKIHNPAEFHQVSRLLFKHKEYKWLAKYILYKRIYRINAIAQTLKRPYLNLRCKLLLLHQFESSLWLYRTPIIDALRAKLDEVGPFNLLLANLPEVNLLCIKLKLPRCYCFFHRDLYAEYERYVQILPQQPRLRKRLTQMAMRRFYKGQNMLTVSEDMKSNILALGIKPKSIQCIYNIFDFTEIKNKSQAYEVPAQDYIIYVGRLEEEKDLFMLLAAYQESEIKQQLILLGQGALKDELAEYISSRGLQGRVIMKDFVSNPYPYIKQARGLVLPSTLEGFPTVLIEALALGVPVASTDCPTGPREILIDELSEFLSPVGGAAALAKNLCKLVNNPPKITDKYVTRFSRENVMPQYLELLESADK